MYGTLDRNQKGTKKENRRKGLHLPSKGLKGRKRVTKEDPMAKRERQSTLRDFASWKKRNASVAQANDVENLVSCPVCGLKVALAEVNKHLDHCVRHANSRTVFCCPLPTQFSSLLSYAPDPAVFLFLLTQQSFSSIYVCQKASGILLRE